MGVKFRNLKITKQLNIGLGTLLLLMVILGVIAFININKMWSATEGIYTHPFTVQAAVGALQVDALSIRLEMKELVIEKNENIITDRLAKIAAYENDIEEQIDILYDRYLGPKTDIDEVKGYLLQWKTTRDETIRLLQNGRQNEAIARSRYDGAGGIAAGVLIDGLGKIHDFAKNKGTQFYSEATTQKNQTTVQLFIIVISTILFAVGVGNLMRKGTTGPLKEITDATEAFRMGNMDARSKYESKNEFGMLGLAFNEMAETVQREMESKISAESISKAIQVQNDLSAFSENLINELLIQTKSQMGALYLLNEQTGAYEHYSSIGLGENHKETFSGANLEGEFGAALVTKKMQHIKELPDSTGYAFSTVIGELMPKEILTIPILREEKVVGLISLASINEYKPEIVQLMTDVWGELTASLNNVLAFQRINEVSAKLQQTNCELEVQSHELSTQSEELAIQNTELEMQKMQLDEASRLKSAFLSNMSHELRTPLNSVIALTSVLNRRLQGAIKEEEHGYLDVIERNGKNLLTLVNSILDISRIEAGKQEINITSFSIEELLEELIEMIRPQAAEKGIALVNNVPINLPNIHSDINMCRHIFQNIIGNGVKFTKAGTVEVSGEMMYGELIISVKDTGIGIEGSKLGYIFDEFRQADESTSKTYGGTGLGLAIAKKYTELLQGSIEVKSIHGEGSVFEVRLPFLKNTSTENEDKAEKQREYMLKETKEPFLGQGKRILLVEDSEPAIIQMKDILLEQGYQVFTARNGKEALESLNITIPDAMILDLMMPEVDGFQVLKAIREVEETAEIPVLILTAKHVTKEELSFLTGNHIFQLIQKGAIGKAELLSAVGKMVWEASEAHYGK